MANPVVFRRGISSDLPSHGMDSDSLYFIEDENTLYKSTGANKPLARYSDVQSGFVDLDDLKVKVPTGVGGKLYLTSNNHIYYYDDSQWKSITAEAQLDEIEASKVNYDSSTSTLTTITAQDAIDELDGKVEVNKLKIKDIEDVLEEVEIDLDKVIVDVATNSSAITTINTDVATVKADVVTVKSDINTIKTDLSDLENDVVANTTAITTLQSADGKVKLKSADTADYLESKLDGNTITVKNNKVKVTGIDGMTVGVADLNHLSGVQSNIQVQISNLTQLISDSSSGLSYIGSFPTKTDLDSYANPENGLLAVVVDSDNEGATVLYIYSETSTSWESIGQFEFADSFEKLKGTPDTYVSGKFLKSTDSQIEYSDIRYTDLIGRPNVSIAKIENAANTAHTHTNATVLDKFTEDTSGNVLYNNKELATNLTWTVFEF